MTRHVRAATAKPASPGVAPGPVVAEAAMLLDQANLSANEGAMLEFARRLAERHPGSHSVGDLWVLGYHDVQRGPQAWFESRSKAQAFLAGKGDSNDKMAEFAAQPRTVPVFVMMPGGEALITGVTLVSLSAGGAA